MYDRVNHDIRLAIRRLGGNLFVQVFSAEKVPDEK